MDAFGRVAVCDVGAKGMQYYVEYFTTEEAAAALAKLCNVAVQGRRLACQCVIPGTRAAKVVLAHSVFVYCDSTVKEVMHTAQLNGAVNYIAYAGLRQHRYMVVTRPKSLRFWHYRIR